jgi:hydrogenase maturation protein HypF
VHEVGASNRLKITVRGAVQGVGFRPFIYRLATGASLAGWVNNSPQGVFIEIEGPRPALEAFLLRLEAERPPRSSIQSLEASWLDPVGYTDFTIRQSEVGGARTALVLPDIATCPDCLAEIFDPRNRRHGYPFTNCTNCGPRFSIIESLPYDRANTSMKRFIMCPQCQAEYDNPLDRRFHAQPNACPACGPQLELWDRNGKVLQGLTAGAQPSGCSNASNSEEQEQDPRLRSSPILLQPEGCTPPPPDQRRSPKDSRSAFAAAAEAIRQGQIVAVKGLGGFHLMVAAHNDQAVRRLRELKRREEKPFALMFPSLAAIQAACEVSPFEERLLRSPEAPIVLLRHIHAPRTKHHALASSLSLAPGNPNLGVMLPYTPLHHLLLTALGFAVVATSGNLSDEPICTDEHEALERLGGIADLFLVHNRPIVRHVDDSIVRVMMGRELILRRARGYAPLPIQLPSAICHLPSTIRSAIGNRQSAIGNSILAVGAHLKNTVALSVGSQVFISQHIGDLETDQSFEAFRRVIADFQSLYESSPVVIAADAHPDYLSTKFALDLVSRSSRRKEAPILTSNQHEVTEPAPYRSPLSSSGGEGRGEEAVSSYPSSPPHEAQSSTSHPSTPTPQLITVQHHIAHVLSCMAENDLEPPVLGVSWDGTGYGLDGTVWGGEFFLITETACERLAYLRQFPLPGGDAAVKEPRRTALGLLHEMFGEAAFAMGSLAPLQAFSPTELGPLKTMLARRLNSPRTSSIGRLFDAVASLAGLRQQVRFEGQAAMELEFALESTEPTNDAYELHIRSDHAPRTTHHAPLLLDWAPMIEALLSDLKTSLPIPRISARYHNALVEAIVAVAKRVGQPRVVLSGGCFQNRYLTERTVPRLQQEGFRPYWHQRIPPNDGGIALGQIVAALRESRAARPA